MTSRRPSPRPRDFPESPIYSQSMPEHPNVALVRKGLECVNERDTEGLLSTWAKDMAYYVVEESGPPSEAMGRDDFVQMMQTGGRMVPDRSYQVVSIETAGDDLVTAHFRVTAHSARTGQPVTGDYVGVFRIRDGLLYEGWEFTSHETQEFLDATWG